jgi:UDP-N-acetylglucosamine 2-epimerase (non-hydrolysing)
MKAAPIMAEMRRFPEFFEQVLVHTGQHYDYAMSAAFFDQLDLPHPDECLEVGSASHARQTARIMETFEAAVLRRRPDWVFVVGDVNSTLACALVCAKLGIKVAHVEAGLRSRDRTMPEEINRIVTDHISDLLFTPSADANENLLEEGARPEQIRFVGNVMIDSLVKMMPRVIACDAPKRLGMEGSHFALATLHRPSNVDHADALDELLSHLGELARILPVLFPVHPRTRARIDDRRIAAMRGVKLLGPLDYISFIALMRAARLVVTDSGGVQEETTWLGVPCLTIRPNTERPVTITCGTNRLITAAQLTSAVQDLMQQPPVQPRRPDMWDGKAAERIVGTMAEYCFANERQARGAAVRD